jgi:hypothetical protein
MRASDGRDCSDGGKGSKASDGGTGSSKGRSRSSSGDGCNACASSSISSSVLANGGTDDELKLAREAAREQTVQRAAAHPQGRGGGSPDRRGRAGGWVD